MDILAWFTDDQLMDAADRASMAANRADKARSAALSPQAMSVYERMSAEAHKAAEALIHELVDRTGPDANV